MWFKILSLQTLRPSCYSSEAQCSAEEKLSSNWKPFYCSPARNKLPRGSSVGTSNPFEIKQPISSMSPKTSQELRTLSILHKCPGNPSLNVNQVCHVSYVCGIFFQSYLLYNSPKNLKFKGACMPLYIIHAWFK